MKIIPTYKTALALSLALAMSAQAQSEPQTNLLAQSVQTINRVEAAQQAQADALQKLLERIDQLEKKGAEQTEAAQTLQKTLDEQQKAHAEREQKLLGKISELEGKIGSLEAGRVLPEIALPSDDAPTTQELQQQIRILERKNELAAEAADAKAKAAPKITAGQNGFGFVSADTNFALRVKGLMQLDSRSFFNDNPYLEGNSGFVLRRVRPILEGTIFRDFDFNFTPDFGGSAATIFDAWLNYRYRPELQLRAGKFKEPLGLENLQSDAVSSFNERGFPSGLVSSRNIGVQLWGEIGEGIVSYAVGVFNGAGDGTQSSQ
ncbi:MAG: porin [Limisphaerales bacterium]